MRILAELLASNGRPQDAALLLQAANHSNSAPALAGDDVARYHELDAELQRALGADVAAGIATMANSTPRVQVFERALRLLAELDDEQAE
ncbi:MAG: hypothetical protein L0H24_06940 [Microlunatus sp.]|nr:hypothetical protein [Microlunatus sp.]